MSMDGNTYGFCRKTKKLWQKTLKKVLDTSSIRSAVNLEGLNEDDLANLRWICAYFDIGINTPPETADYESALVSHDTWHDCDTTGFNVLASVHSITDIERAAAVVREIERL
jgi:hypothetical protein